MSAVGSVVGQCPSCGGRVSVIESGGAKRPDHAECEGCGAEYGVVQARGQDAQPEAPATNPIDDIPF